MAQMNQTQVRYARQRADQILADKRTEINAKHTTKSTSLDAEGIYEALLNGNFKMQPFNSRAYYIRDFMSFPQEIVGKFDRDAAEKEMAPIQAQYVKLMDELILGDNEEALALLKAFEAA